MCPYILTKEGMYMRFNLLGDREIEQCRQEGWHVYRTIKSDMDYMWPRPPTPRLLRHCRPLKKIKRRRG